MEARGRILGEVGTEPAQSSPWAILIAGAPQKLIAVGVYLDARSVVGPLDDILSMPSLDGSRAGSGGTEMQPSPIEAVKSQCGPAGDEIEIGLPDLPPALMKPTSQRD
tara:strand:+ start:25 stop:348 length:324 start_codon:yes stop_codon:yes gene_type:complete